jgi:hypothetical protein
MNKDQWTVLFDGSYGFDSDKAGICAVIVYPNGYRDYKSKSVIAHQPHHVEYAAAEFAVNVLTEQMAWYYNRNKGPYHPIVFAGDNYYAIKNVQMIAEFLNLTQKTDVSIRHISKLHEASDDERTSPIFKAFQFCDRVSRQARWAVEKQSA